MSHIQLLIIAGLSEAALTNDEFSSLLLPSSKRRPVCTGDIMASAIRLGLHSPQTTDGFELYSDVNRAIASHVKLLMRHISNVPHLPQAILDVNESNVIYASLSSRITHLDLYHILIAEQVYDQKDFRSLAIACNSALRACKLNFTAGYELLWKTMENVKNAPSDHPIIEKMRPFSNNVSWRFEDGHDPTLQDLVQRYGTVPASDNQAADTPV